MDHRGIDPERGTDREGGWAWAGACASPSSLP